MDKKEFQITADGSHTLYLPKYDETYHSVNGAVQESEHIYINAGLRYVEKEQINILEIGFGTGLNAFLTLLEAEKKNVQINYITLETFPLSAEITNQLNYPKTLNSSDLEIELFYQLHKVEWESNQELTTHFTFKKLKMDVLNYTADQQFDVIYFDAFAPEIQPELWVEAVFEKMYILLNKDGILVTYCAKGIVKRALKAVGFKVENLPGPPGKREITRAIKL